VRDPTAGNTSVALRGVLTLWQAFPGSRLMACRAWHRQGSCTACGGWLVCAVPCTTHPPLGNVLQPGSNLCSIYIELYHFALVRVTCMSMTATGAVADLKVILVIYRGALPAPFTGPFSIQAWDPAYVVVTPLQSVCVT